MATTSPDRILTLDVIRGIAVMGIFSVNVVGMAMIESAYFYPPDYGFDHGYDKLMWALNSILVDGRCAVTVLDPVRRLDDPGDRTRGGCG